MRAIKRVATLIPVVPRSRMSGDASLSVPATCDRTRDHQDDPMCVLRRNAPHQAQVNGYHADRVDQTVHQHRGTHQFVSFHERS
jgi:hypothetical protein